MTGTYLKIAFTVILSEAKNLVDEGVLHCVQDDCGIFEMASHDS